MGAWNGKSRLTIAMAGAALACAAPASAGHPSVGFTHEDTAPAPGSLSATAVKAPSFGLRAISDLAPTWCGDPTTSDNVANATTRLPHFKVLYAFAADQPNRFAMWADFIQRKLREISAIVAATSNQTKTVRLDIGTRCGSQYADIQTVALPKPLVEYQDGDAPTRFRRIRDDVRALVPANGAPRNYVIWGDLLRQPGGGAGVANALSDENRFGNIADRGEYHAIVYGTDSPTFLESDAFATVAALHEMTHLMGAVQDGAPHSTKAGHCFDENDLMCQDEKGASPPVFACGSGPDVDEESPIFDCNLDYFSPAPPGGSYLATNWNTYDSGFLCAMARCRNDPPAPVLTVTRSAGTSRPVTADARATTDDAPGLSFTFDVNGDGQADASTGIATTLTFHPPSPGSFRPSVLVTDADGISRAAVTTLVVPPTLALSQLVVSSSARRPDRIVIRYRLDAPAPVQVAFDKFLSGRRRGESCVAPSRAKRGSRCTRTRRMDRPHSASGKKGVNLLRLSKRWVKGRYRLTIVATGAAPGPIKRSFSVTR